MCHVEHFQFQDAAAVGRAHRIEGLAAEGVAVAHRVRQFRSLVAPCADDMRFRHRPDPWKCRWSEW